MAVDLNAGKSGKGARPDINVTPLVDVVLVLLIIFMVVIPSVQDGKSIELFRTKVAKADSEEPDKTVVTVDAGERYYLGSEELPRRELLARLDVVAQTEPDKPIVIRGDVRVPYSVVRDLFHEAQLRGIPGVKLAVGNQKQGFTE